jgi:hypothetical protein
MCGQTQRYDFLTIILEIRLQLFLGVFEDPKTIHNLENIEMIESLRSQGELEPHHFYFKQFLDEKSQQLKVMDSEEIFNQTAAMCNRMLAKMVKSESEKTDVCSLKILNYMALFSRESAEIVWNKTFVDYGFLNMSSNKFQTTHREFDFEELIQVLTKSGRGLSELLSICSSLVKINKNVSDFIFQGIHQSPSIINVVQ